MPNDVMQRETWNGPAMLGEGLRLHKSSCGKNGEAVLELWSHQFGWELRLLVDDDLRHSQVCRNNEQVLTTTEQWKSAMVGRGWGVTPSESRRDSAVG